MDEAEFDFRDLASWDRLILRSPELAHDRASQALGVDPIGVDRLVLLYALGRSQFEMGRVHDAAAVLGEAVEMVPVEAPADSVQRAVLTTGAIVFAEAGQIEAALDSLDVVAGQCEGVELGRVLVQRALVLHHAGRLGEALESLDRSERLFTDPADPADDRDRWRLHQNRGVILLQHGRLDAAEGDLMAAADLARRLGMTAAEGQCHANAGALYGRSRRLFDALAAFERADRLLTAAGRPDRTSTWMEIDRAEVMMHSGLLDDAVAAAYRALHTAEPSGNATLVGDALLMCAQTELRADRLRQAIRTAEAARDQMVATGRSEMVAHADGIAARARLRSAVSETAAEAFQRSAVLLERLRRLGWQEQADALVAERFRAAWRLGEWDPVAVDVEAVRLLAFGERRDLALLGWFAEAVARSHDGDPLGSVEACTRGLDFLDDITAETVDLEARSAAMQLGHDLSRWIIEVAIELGDADLVLAAGEGTRARSLHDELDARQRHRPLTEEGADRLCAELRAGLLGACLVQWVVAGDRVHAVVCDERGNRLVDVADLRSVIRERDRLMVWLDRAAGEPDGSSQRAARAAGLLDELLLAPLELVSDGGVVIVPVDALHGVPWSGLPSIARRPVMISPSCRMWLDAEHRCVDPVRTMAFVAGPDVAADDTERSALRALCPDLHEATGTAASATAVRTMFVDDDLVHVAAHGRFRADRPLLSTLEFADGEVALHESIPERVGARLVVLSSCEGGAHRGTGGSEVLGLASVLLARGAASVLAPLTVVRDLECGEFVSEVHRALGRGATVAEAVAGVRSRWLGDDDLSRWAVASSFACFGSGSVRVER